MSVIWGCIDFSGAPLSEELCEAMRAPFDRYKIDRFECGARGNVVMGCGIQYITPEADREPLPIFDEEAGIYFTADCMIDNRRELIADLCPARGDIPDGELMYLAYKKWGDDTPAHLRGSFSYAAYDVRNCRFQLAADHVFSRPVYYCREGSRLFFSSLIKPIVAGLSKKPGINERWVCDYLGRNNLVMLTEPEETPFAGIRKVVAANYIVFDATGQCAVRYWEPEKLPPLRLKDHGEYRDMLVSILESAASEVSRSSGETGLLLSGGLDSSSVAAFFAPELEKQGRRLYSYTSVPDAKFGLDRDGQYIMNERSEVERLCGMYPNIRPTFAAFEDRDAFSEVERLVDTLEGPYKSASNIMWLDGLMSMAAADGCRVILSGQAGNGTISFGDALAYICTKFYGGRPDIAFRFFNTYCKQHGISRRKCAPIVISALTPGALKRLPYRDYIGFSYLNHEKARSVGISKRSRNFTANTKKTNILTLKKKREFLFGAATMSHVGDMDMKLTLRHGLVSRDITQDKRIWEFCFRVPSECFVGPSGVERRLVREYLSDRLPAEHLAPRRKNGLQSADWQKRIGERWPELYPWVRMVLESDPLADFLNVEKVREELDAMRDEIDNSGLLYLSFPVIMGVFLQRNFQ